MSSNYYGSIAGEIADAGPSCRTCNDTGIVQCAEQDGSGVYEQACPEPAHKAGRVVTCLCDWPHGHCETCARVWGYTAVHVTPDGTCAMYGHREGDLT